MRNWPSVRQRHTQRRELNTQIPHEDKGGGAREEGARFIHTRSGPRRSSRSYLLSGSAGARLRVTKHILRGMLLRSRWKDGGCDASGSGAPAPSRGDSGGGVSQPISDTGEPLVT